MAIYLETGYDMGMKAAEIAKRLREIDTGAVKMVPWSEAREIISKG